MDRILSGLEFSYVREGLVDESYHTETQILSLKAVEGVNGIYYILKTQGEYGFSFQDAEEIVEVLKDLQKATRAVFDE